MARPVKIGIIGGSGLDDPDIIIDRLEKFVDTPFGKPSDCLVFGKIKDVDCVLLARHGRKHDLMPSNVNYRANVWAMKAAGVSHLIVTTACGSLQEQLHPGDIVFLDQFIDSCIHGTTKRSQTFYDGAPTSPRGICHIPMAKPFCPKTTQILIKAAKTLGLSHHEKGTNISIEGPRFSTIAESKLFRSWGADVVNMTTVPEVVLAREAALCYAAIALVTDYDCWKADVEHVNVEAVMKTLKENNHRAIKLLVEAIPLIATEDWSKELNDLAATVKGSVM